MFDLLTQIEQSQYLTDRPFMVSIFDCQNEEQKLVSQKCLKILIFPPWDKDKEYLVMGRPKMTSNNKFIGGFHNLNNKNNKSFIFYKKF